MRIATWNLERATGRAKTSRRRDLIASVDADIWVLTETHDVIDLAPFGHHSVQSAQDQAAQPGERWVTIWSRFPITRVIAVEDSVRTTAALVDSPVGALIVFGTVLPWHADRGPRGDAPAWSEHHRVIETQGKEWVRLTREHPGVPLCVAGDFNTDLGGERFYGTMHGRGLLLGALEAAALACVTETPRVPAGKLRHPPIDHVCVSQRLAARATLVDAWEGTTRDGVRLSDHSGLVVEVV